MTFFVEITAGAKLALLEHHTALRRNAEIEGAEAQFQAAVARAEEILRTPNGQRMALDHDENDAVARAAARGQSAPAAIDPTYLAGAA